ncbi:MULTISPECIES: M24 family metallopeptidase [Pseudoalteromonas]|uniref:Xaa-pro aminopeptidase n=1 Tax=Pseudoalteromonas luteoviolacea (strain 2ta16) TaxID=1353533 RepID=V4HIV1_PSEL2|nr:MULTISPECIES: Xaa-Pro peptidase family protein [Pseudoalteromonas]ESP90735.1 Xaa-pro aminopeptidase [Pseudoalteromonas luteoviolacea 2ta16]KZN41691.1 X-Pro dipeptidase [Pseudoalteromonas luteoviolacea NCIMB 1944]MCG7548148.1 Xaa-Pro peptidase family protein [Pseudoalteromonas sp. Of7M-16]
MIGIGFQTKQAALDSLNDMTAGATPITEAEYRARMHKAQTYMREHDIDALYLNAGTNLKYFTGLSWSASERLVGALLPANGDVCFIAPYFELGTISDYQVVQGKIYAWQEEESPYQLLGQALSECGIEQSATLAVDESTAFFTVDGIVKANSQLNVINAHKVTSHCRMHKSENELALIQRAMDMTLAVHQAAASMLHEGITTTEVEAFIEQAHKKVGAPGNYFCIVLFGKASSFPHGVKEPQTLKKGDVVLIDTGCKLHGYLSDITRTYVYGEATEFQREMWQHEKQAQLQAFNAAQIGATCGDVDHAARSYLAAQSLGPDYQLPGCPHRTGHGIGLDIHELPYLVKDNPQALAPGMCFSNEPMLVVPDEFGIRLEDHFYMTEAGAKWFTEPSHSIDDPFGLEK